MIMQTAYLFSGSVAENLRFGPRQQGREMSDGEVGQLLQQVGLAGFAERSVANLSGGEGQRVSIARALANSPVILLADEPTSSLDDEAKQGVEALIRDVVRQHGLTCVMVTHDTAQARRISNRVVTMVAGRVLRVGATREVLNGEPV